MSDIHLTFLLAAVPAILVSDVLGLRWLLGGAPLPARLVTILHYWVYLVLTGLITTGVMMFLRDAEYLWSLPFFKFKMLLVGSLMINSFVIGKHLSVATAKRFAELSRDEKMSLILSGVLSAVCWVGAALSGFNLS